MNWKSYTDCLLEHQIYFRKMKILSYYSKEAFNSFPKNLPSKIQKDWQQDINSFINALDNVIDRKGGKASAEMTSKLSMDKFMVMVNYTKLEKELPYNEIFNFEEMIINQHLIMVYAKLDAFFHETLLRICKINPRILIHQVDDFEKKNTGNNMKVITFKQILEFGDYDRILETMIDDFLYKLGMKSLESRLMFIKDKLSLNLNITKEDLKFIYNGEKFRHCIIHRGGYVDERLLQTLTDTRLTLGEPLKLDNEYLNSLYDKSERLTIELFNSVSKKYYKISDLDIENAIGRKSPANKSKTKEKKQYEPVL
jgi:hypothetical protein